MRDSQVRAVAAGVVIETDDGYLGRVSIRSSVIHIPAHRDCHSGTHSDVVGGFVRTCLVKVNDFAGIV